MADKETGLFIPVSAYADKDSAKAAINDLTKGVLSSLKDGYIEIPAEIKASYTRGSKELDKAQKDVIKLYEKMSKEGFSSSTEELDDLIEKYKKFKSLAGKEGKGNSKQTKWLTKTIGETLQPYLAQKRELESIVKSFEDSVKSINKSTNKKPRNLGKHSKAEIDANIRQQRNRQYKGLSSIGPKGPGSGSSIDPGRTNEHLMRLSEYSAHGSKWADELAKTLKLEMSKAAKELVRWIEPNYKPKEVGGKSRNTTEKEMLSDTAKQLRGEIASTIRALEKGDTEVGTDDLITKAGVLKTIYGALGKGAEEAGIAVSDAIQSVYDSPTSTRLGGTSREEGSAKGIGPGHDVATKATKELLEVMKSWSNEAIADRIAAEMVSAGGNIDTKAISKLTSNINSQSNKLINEIAESQQIANNAKLMNKEEVATSEDIRLQTFRESAREGLADKAEGRTTKDTLDVERSALDVARDDAGDGFNSENNAQSLIRINTQIQTVLENIQGVLQNIFDNGIGGPSEKSTMVEESKNLPSTYVADEHGILKQTKVEDKTDRTIRGIVLPKQSQYDKAYAKSREPKVNTAETIAKIEEERAQIEKGEHESQQRTFLQRSEINTYKKGIAGAIQKALKGLGHTSKASRIMSMNAEEQEKLRAERIERFGLNRGRNLTDTGDIADVKRTKALFGWNYKRDQQNKELFKDIKLTPGFTGKEAINTTDIMKRLNKVLSGSEMFKAQTGGTLRNIIGSMTGYIGMPSLEKSRAQADGLNQVMANVRKEVLGLIQDVQAKEATLAGMEKMGTARFDKEGRISADSSLAAKNTFEKLEEQKKVLKSALAEVGMIDEVVAKTGGKVSKIIKELGFVMPELMQNNTIIQNINAGLDKNGKALKFQKRTAEVLNYTFQLMARHVGQMLKNWLMQVNPINQIKRAFKDFMSYNPKWQRTMNVVKYNLRDIILPIMEKIAQLLVNMIGFVDIILQRIQKAFGNTPISLFDQQNAQDFKNELEKINNITAGFDELHDIGVADENSADNLLGDIYTPNLPESWENAAEGIGDTLGGLLSGDLGLGEALGRAWDAIKKFWNEKVWPFLRDTVGPFIKEHWLEILAAILGIFLAWKGLNIMAEMFWKGLFGKFTASNIKGLFTKIGGWIKGALGKAGTWIAGVLGASGIGQRNYVRISIVVCWW